MRIFLHLISLCLTIIANFSFAQTNVPNTFTDGSPALAEEVNENFDVLEDAIDTNTDAVLGLAAYLDQRYIVTESYISSYNFNADSPFSSQITAAVCPVGTALLGGGVACFGENTNYNTTNVGLLASGTPDGNSYLGLCFATDTADSSKFGPGITVTAICGSIVNTDSNFQLLTIQNLTATETQDSSDNTEKSQGLMNSKATAAFKRLENEKNKIIRARSNENL